MLEQKLASGEYDDPKDAGRVVQLVNEAISKTRELSRGLLPVEADELGLMSALEQWAGEVENLYSIMCQFTCNTPILIHDESVATHAYRIAQEAVNNTIKHGEATRIDL